MSLGDGRARVREPVGVLRLGRGEVAARAGRRGGRGVVLGETHAHLWRRARVSSRVEYDYIEDRVSLYLGLVFINLVATFS